MKIFDKTPQKEVQAALRELPKPQSPKLIEAPKPEAIKPEPPKPELPEKIFRLEPGPIVAMLPEVTRWQYRSVVMELNHDLTAEFGEQGWELVSVAILPHDPNRACFYFKRRK